MPFDLEFWKRWEGQSIDETFPLERCIGLGSRGAVFETRFQAETAAAIKLVPGTPQSIEALLALFERALGLSHPALIRTLAYGKCALGETDCAYIVMERAEENLSEVLAERPLTPAEARELLVPLLDALRYLRSKGFAHGRLKPSNILAIGDQLKISSDGLVPGGDSLEDCAAIGALLEGALGAGKSPLPSPFAEIVRHCQAPDTSARWSLERIEECLRGVPASAGPGGKSKLVWWGLALAAAAILGLAALWPSPTGNANLKDTEREPVKSAAPASTAAALAEDKPSPLSPPPPSASRKSQKRAATQPTSVTDEPPRPSRAVTQDGITQRAPEISRDALNTIVGRVRINVRVQVDNAGNVGGTILETPAASRYFSSRLLAAAREWKFPPGEASRVFVLHYELMRDKTSVTVEKIGK